LNICGIDPGLSEALAIPDRDSVYQEDEQGSGTKHLHRRCALPGRHAWRYRGMIDPRWGQWLRDSQR
jgi:hypothetical protein